MLESPIEEKQPLIWIGLGGLGGSDDQSGMVFFSTSQELVAHRVRDGQLVWRLPVQDKNFTGTASLIDDSLLMQDTEGSMWVINIYDGKVRSRVSFPTVHSIATWIQPMQDRWQLATQSQAASLTAQGKVYWRDGLGQLPGQVIVAQWVSQPLVGLLTAKGVNPFEGPAGAGGKRLVQPLPGVRVQIRRQNVAQPQAIPPNQEEAADDVVQAPVAKDGAYELLLLDRQTGSVVLRQTMTFAGRPFQLRQALMLDNAMVIGDATSTIVIPSQTTGQ